MLIVITQFSGPSLSREAAWKGEGGGSQWSPWGWTPNCSADAGHRGPPGPSSLCLFRPTEEKQGHEVRGNGQEMEAKRK